MNIYAFVWLVALLPAIGALLSFLAENPRSVGRLCRFATWLSWILAVGLLAYRLVHHADPTYTSTLTFLNLGTAAPFPDNLDLQLGLQVDALSLVLLVLFPLVGWAVQSHTTQSLRGDSGYAVLFWAMALLTSAANLAAASVNLFTMLIALSFGGVVLWLLTNHWWHRPEVVGAARRLWLALRVADLCLVLAVVFALVKFGRDLAAQTSAAAAPDQVDLLAFGALGREWSAAHLGLVPGVGMRTLVIMSGLIIVVGLIHAAQWPFQAWLTDATAAPAPVPALACSIGTAAGVVVLARNYPLILEVPHALTVVAFMGGLTAAVAAILAIGQRDVLRLAVQTAIAQVGLAVLALGGGGYSMGLLTLLVVTPLNALLFLCATSLVRAYRSRDILDMGGGWTRLRATSLAVVVWAVAAGGADLVGYDVLATLMRNTTPSGGRLGTPSRLLLIGMAVVALGALSIAAARLVHTVIFGAPRPRRGFQAERMADVEPRVRRTFIVVAAAAILGVVAGLPMAAPYTFSHFVFYGAKRQELNFLPGVLILALAVALGAAAVGWLLYAPERQATVVRPWRRSSGDAVGAKTVGSTVGASVGSAVAEMVAGMGARSMAVLGELIVALDQRLVGPIIDAAGAGLIAVGEVAVSARRGPSLLASFGFVVIVAAVVAAMAASGHLPTGAR